MVWESGWAWPLALSGGGAALVAGMLLAARAIVSRRRGARAAAEARRRDRAILSLSEALGREQSSWAMLREAAGCAAVVSNCDDVWTWVGGGTGGGVGGPGIGIRSLRPGPSYPAWSDRAEDRITAISLARDAIRAGIPVPAPEDRGRPGRWLALPLVDVGSVPAALVLYRSGTGDWSPDEMSNLLRLTRLTARALERARAEASLAAERDRFASLHRDTPDMDLLLDPEGRILRTSRRVSDVLGYAADELEGESLGKIIAPGRGLEVEDLLLETLLHGRLHRDALPLRRVDGQTIDSQMEAVPALAAGGGTIGFRLTLREDSGIGQLLDEQGIEIERLGAELDAAREEIIWADADWHAREEALEEEIRDTLLEREEAEARRGLVGARERLDHEREIAGLRKQLDASREPAAPVTPVTPLAMKVPGGSSDARPLRATQALVDRDSGRILEAGPDLARLLGVPADDLIGRRLSEFHGINRSPDLRRRYEDLLAGGGGTLPDLPAASGMSSVARTAWSIEAHRWTEGLTPENAPDGTTLLVTWRPQAAAPRPVTGPRPLLSLLEDCVRDVRSEADRRGIVVHLSAAEDPLLSRAAPAELAEAVSGLIENALRLTPAGGEIRVEAGTEDDSGLGRCVRVVVRDNGIGIPTEDLRRLFELGAPAESSASADMGRCRAIIQRLGGRLAADSQVGIGTEFRLTLPGEAQ